MDTVRFFLWHMVKYCESDTIEFRKAFSQKRLKKMVSNSTVSLTCACVVSHAQFKISVTLCGLGNQA